MLQVAGVAEVAKDMSKEDSERLLAHLVYTGILHIDFGYTAYATTAYLKCSQRGAHTLAGQPATLCLL